MIKAIETIYKGYRFRSRLEARWAVFFDALKLPWEYEPEGFEFEGGLRYLPDFRVEYPGRNETEIHKEWFEVKGDLKELTDCELAKIYEFSKHHRITILDGTPRPTMFTQYGPDDHENGVYDHKTDLSLPFNITEIKKDLFFTATLENENRSGWALWSDKGRMWWDDHVNYFSPTTCFGSDNSIEYASDKARQARFEHGENGR